MALPDEKTLVARAAVEPDAFAAIYDHYFDAVYRYVSYRVSDAASAEDLTSEVFERALARISTYRPKRGDFAPWLFGIVRNAVSDHLRKAQRRHWWSLDVVLDRHSRDLQPDEASARSEEWRQLNEALGRLPDRERDLIALKFGGGLTNRQIAGLMGLSESNVSVILYRTIKRLRMDVNEE